MKKFFPKHIINHQIKFPEIRVVDEQGNQLGVMKTGEALKLAQQNEVDLILITAKTNPPVCKLISLGKYLYQQKKHEKKSKTTEIKNIRLNFNISIHDIETKAKQAKNFLEEGNKVKVELILRGREKTLSHFGKEKIKKFIEILATYLPIELDQEIKKTPFGFISIIKKSKNEEKNSQIII